MPKYAKCTPSLCAHRLLCNKITRNCGRDIAIPGRVRGTATLASTSATRPIGLESTATRCFFLGPVQHPQSAWPGPQTRAQRICIVLRGVARAGFSQWTWMFAWHKHGVRPQGQPLPFHRLCAVSRLRSNKIHIRKNIQDWGNYRSRDANPQGDAF